MVLQLSQLAGILSSMPRNNGSLVLQISITVGTALELAIKSCKIESRGLPFRVLNVEMKTLKVHETANAVVGCSSKTVRLFYEIQTGK